MKCPPHAHAFKTLSPADGPIRGRSILEGVVLPDGSRSLAGRSLRMYHP